MKKFDKHKDILKHNPDELIKEFDSEENPRDVDQIRDEIRDYYAKEKELTEEIPS